MVRQVPSSHNHLVVRRDDRPANLDTKQTASLSIRPSGPVLHMSKNEYPHLQQTIAQGCLRKRSVFMMNCVVALYRAPETLQVHQRLRSSSKKSPGELATIHRSPPCLIKTLESLSSPRRNCLAIFLTHSLQ